MNLKFKFLALFFTVAIATQAQTVYMKPHLGLRAGLNISRSTYSPNFIYNLKAQSHPNLGVFYRFRTKKWAFQPELQLSVRGGTFKGENEIVKNNLNYGSFVPVIGYIITEGLTFEVAPEFSYLLHTPNTIVPLRRNEMSLGTGLRFDFMDMAEDFSLNIRYIHGLNNLSTSQSESFSNRTLQVSVIYNLYKKK